MLDNEGGNATAAQRHSVRNQPVQAPMGMGVANVGCRATGRLH
jgi:hypothetical protein